MAWELGDYKPRSDAELKNIFENARLDVGRTVLRMYNVILRDKKPVLKDPYDDPDDEEEMTPAQARYAFSKRWVPERWVQAMAEIAKADGKTDHPSNEDLRGGPQGS